MRKTFNAGKELASRGFNQVVAVTAGMVVLTGEVLAAVPTEVTTAIAETKTDSTAVAALMVGISAALLVFAIIRRLLK